MIQVLGITLKQNRPIKYELLKIYGLGLSSICTILKEVNVSPIKKILELSMFTLIRIRKIIEAKFLISNFLKRVLKNNILTLIRLKCLRGKRHQLLLPVNGQRTRTNARTRRGKKKTISHKKK